MSFVIKIVPFATKPEGHLTLTLNIGSIEILHLPWNGAEEYRSS